MVKPDGVGRRLVGECIRRYERRGLKLAGLKMQIVSVEMAHKHYEEHQGKGFFDSLVAFITSGPTVQMVWEGPDAVAQVRKMNGATHWPKSASCDGASGCGPSGPCRSPFGLSA